MYEDMMNIELTHSHEEARFAYHCLHSRSESAEQQAVYVGIRYAITNYVHKVMHGLHGTS